jgi:hypothetical protein
LNITGSTLARLITQGVMPLIKALTFWLTYRAICMLSGQLHKQAEMLVVDVGVPVSAPSFAGPASRQASNLAGRRWG